MKKTGVTIDDQHVYHTDDGRVVLGVTSIIRAAGLMGDTSYYTELARERGKVVHAVVEMYEQDDLDEDSLDSDIVPYLDAWKLCKHDTGFESETQEQIIFNPTYQYAGTLDLAGFIGNDTAVIDLKTGVYAHWWALQTAAYNAVAKCKKRFSLELHNDGKYKLTEHTDKRDFQRFLACLTIAGIKQSWGIK